MCVLNTVSMLSLMPLVRKYITQRRGYLSEGQIQKGQGLVSAAVEELVSAAVRKSCSAVKNQALVSLVPPQDMANMGYTS